MADLHVRDEKLSRSGRRTRKTHAKVRTGCITCKIRRKKCDESKPQCLRCTSTGRKCDGYVQQLHNQITYTSQSFSIACIPKTRHSNTQYTEHIVGLSEGCSERQSDDYGDLSICRSPSIRILSSDADAHCFDFFRLVTGPQVESFFDNSIWRSEVLRAAATHPVLLKIAAALGAVHQRFNHGISRQAFDFCAIADRLHRDAIKTFVQFQREDRSSPTFHEVSAVTSMLFALFEGFQDNPHKIVQHTKFALESLWSRPFIVSRSESQYRNYEIQPYLFTKLFRKFYFRAAQLFGSPPKLTLWNPGKPPRPIPPRFQSPEEARDSLFTEAEWILHTPGQFWRNEKRRHQLQHLHVTRMLQWSMAYAEMVLVLPERTHREKAAGVLLKHVRDACYVLLYVVFFVAFDHHQQQQQPSSTGGLPTPPIDATSNPDQDSSYSDLFQASNVLFDLMHNRTDLATKFARVSFLADSAVDADSPYNYGSHSMNVSTGIGPPSERKHALVPESSNKTRHLVRRYPGREGADDEKDPLLWNVLGVYKMLERMTTLEEHALLAAVGRILPKHVNLHWVDVTCFLEERRLLLRYCRPDGLGERSRGLIWVQEWLQF